MNIIYEVNPPKILNDDYFDTIKLESEINKFLDRVEIISHYTDFIHVTDSVLGIPRISSIHAVHLINDRLKNANMKISCSVRTRDRNLNSIIQLVTQSVFLNIHGLLFVLGDESSFEDKNSKYSPLSIPTNAIKVLKRLGFDKRINLNLSVPNKISSINLFKKKIESNPHSFITQSINSLKEIYDIQELLQGQNIKLIPCIMVPSKKNILAAKMIGLDWREYEDDFIKFLYNIKQKVDNILITSPNSFDDGINILRKVDKN